MKAIIFSFIFFLFLSIYIISSSGEMMQKIAEYRFHTESIIKSSRYRFGDLYGLSYLADFKKEIWKEKSVIGVEPCGSQRNINLFVICDSYLHSFIKNDSIFCGVKSFRMSRWGLYEPIDIEIDTTEINILLIERVERCCLCIPLPDYLDKINFVKRSHTAKKLDNKIIIQNASFSFINTDILQTIHTMIMNKNINQNLEFNLFDYLIFTPLRELKAQWNYKLFGRLSKEVTIIPNVPYLFMSETVDSESGQSAFRPIPDDQVNLNVETLNSTYDYYRRNGFDEVYYTIAPNPVSILCPGYKPYNELVRRIQNHPKLIMPMINMFEILGSASCQVYYNADSHWNYNGFNMWVNEVNKLLRTKNISKKETLEQH